MSKEIFIAILLGFGIGIIITYGIWTANRALQQKQQTLSPVPTEAIQPPNSDTTNNDSQNPPIGGPNSDLVINQPEPNTVTDIDTLSVSGTAKPNSTVIIYTENDHHLLVADNQGKFIQDVTLLTGINYLTITAVINDSTPTTIDRTVIYTTAEF